MDSSYNGGTRRAAASRHGPSIAAGAATAHAAVPLVTVQRDRVLAGYNGNGQLGDGTNEGLENVPTAVSTATVTSWLAISAGGYHTMALTQ